MRKTYKQLERLTSNPKPKGDAAELQVWRRMADAGGELYLDREAVEIEVVYRIYMRVP